MSMHRGVLVLVPFTRVPKWIPIFDPQPSDKSVQSNVNPGISRTPG